MSTAAPAITLERRLRWSLSPTSLAAIALLTALVGLEVWAGTSGYPLRVTGEAPTYLALLRAMAAHPLSPGSPFLAAGATGSPFATPYMLGLALLWQAIAPASQVNNPIAAGRFLGLIGIPVSLATLATIGWFAARLAGRRQGLLTIPVLLVVLGPAQVISSGVLNVNGLLYAGFYPQNVAIALALAALIALRGQGWLTLAPACALTGTAMLVDPLIGTLLAGLAAADGCVRAWRGEPGMYRSSAALSLGFIAAMAWPAYQLNRAMALAGLPGSVVVAACVVAPRLIAMLVALLRSRRVPAVVAGRVRAAGEMMTAPRTRRWLAIAGALFVWDLALWVVLLLLNPSSEHLNHGAIYWTTERWRWFLLLGAGAAGCSGLVSLARRGAPLPLLWLGGCLGIAAIGALGGPVTGWWRWLLLAQIPLAIGTATVLLETSDLLTRRLIGGTLAFALVVELCTLLTLPDSITYFGSPPQRAYTIGRMVPGSPAGLVASDPYTSYYLPAATGHHVLTLATADLTSRAEANAAARGYALLHALYSAPDTGWWPAAQALWKAGVRYVVLDKGASLGPATLQQFSSGPATSTATASGQWTMDRMRWRLERIAELAGEDRQYAVYILNGATLLPPTRTHRGSSGS